MDDEIERLAQAYAGADFRKRRRLRVEPVCEYGSNEWALDDFIALIAKVKAEMPPDAEDAKVEFDSGGVYDEGGKFVVSYVTWEDEAAVEDRVNRSLRYARELQNAERYAYERLKRKFETSK